MYINVYSAAKKISTTRILIFQLYTDLSTISTAGDIKSEMLEYALPEADCQKNGNLVDECRLYIYLPMKKRNGMGFVVYNTKINLNRML